MFEDMPDSEKLKAIADWFDIQDKQGYFGNSPGNQVQTDLRRIAKRLKYIEGLIEEEDGWLIIVNKSYYESIGGRCMENA